MVSSDNTQKTPFTRQAMSGIRIAVAALVLVLGGFDRTQAEQSGPFAGVVVDSSLINLMKNVLCLFYDLRKFEN